MTGRAVFSPSRPSGLVTRGDAGRAPRNATRTSGQRRGPCPAGTTPQPPQTASGSRGARRETGLAANPRAGAGRGCPATGRAPR